MSNETSNFRQWISRLLERPEGLSRELRKHHVTGIAISGTIGAGLFISSGEILATAGPLGAIIAYAAAGFMVMCVMMCLAEMISVWPYAGAFFEFPSLFVHPSLGFATSWAYWLAYTCSCSTLTVSAALLLDYWKPELSIPAAIAVAWVPIILFSFFGSVLWYGRLEWTVKWLKMGIIVVALITMIGIAAGVRGFGSVSIEPPSSQWNRNRLFPPGFCVSGANSRTCRQDGDISGGGGVFLGIWTSITIAMFAFIGVEIVVITAGEARYPRHDLPIAARWIYWFAIVVYILLIAVASLNVSYDDPALLQYVQVTPENIGSETLSLFPDAKDGSITTGDRSPFVIAVKRAGFDSVFPGFLNACLYFAALTAANTAFYVSSRTLYQLCNSGSTRESLRRRLGSTSYLGLPLWAIGITICFSGFSFVGAINGVHNEIIGVVSRISVTSILCVYVSQCWAFIRYQDFYWRHFGNNRHYELTRGHENCYRSGLHQPIPAWIGIILGSLLVIFNGWDTVYLAVRPQGDLSQGGLAAGIIKSYFGPCLFLILFAVHKYRHQTQFVGFQVAIDTLDQISRVSNELDRPPLRWRNKWRQVLLEMK